VWHAWKRREEKSEQSCGGEIPMKRDRLEHRGIVGRMGSELNLVRLAGGGVEWIQLAHDRAGGGLL
jgi:hypothetical protein